jgi:predicted DNA-binding transcriptional regulator AlpA
MAMPPHHPAGDLLTKQEVARLLRVCVRTLERHVALGKFLAPIRLSQRCIRWRRKDIDDYLEQFGKKCAAPQKRRTG